MHRSRARTHTHTLTMIPRMPLTLNDMLGVTRYEARRTLAMVFCSTASRPDISAMAARVILFGWTQRERERERGRAFEVRKRKGIEQSVDDKEG